MEGQALEKVKTKVGAAVDVAVQSARNAEEIADLLINIGEIRAAARISRNLESAVIVGLQQIRDEKKYIALGFERFDQCLDEWHRSPMKYKRFNYLEKMHEELGPQSFDLMRGSGLSYRQMKMLEAGDVVVDGQEVVIGGQDRVSLGESRVVKDLVERLVQDRIAERNASEKKDRKIESQAAQIEAGQVEIETRQRRIDRLEENTTHDNAFMRLIGSFDKLVHEISTLSDAERDEVGSPSLQAISKQYYRLSDAYGVKRSLTDAVPADDPILQKMIADGEFEDLDD